MNAANRIPRLSADVETFLPLPVGKVWRILTDFDRQEEWIPQWALEGDAELGADVDFRMRLRNGMTILMPAVVESVHFNCCLRVRIKFSLFSILQVYELRPAERGVVLAHHLSVHGLLAPLMPRTRVCRNLHKLGVWFGKKLQAECFVQSRPKFGKRP